MSARTPLAHPAALNGLFASSTRQYTCIDTAKRGVHLDPLLNAAERGLDFLTVIAAVYAAYAFYQVTGAGKQAQYATSTVLLAAAGFALLFVLLLERHGGYCRYLSLLAVRDTERILRVTIKSFLLALVAAYFLHASVSRLVLLFSSLTVPLFLMLQKWEVYNAVRMLRSKGYGARRVVIYGAGTLGKRIYSALVRSPKLGLDPVAFVDDDPQKWELEVYESSYRRKRPAKVVAGPVCPELLRDLGASVLVIAVPGLSREAMMSAIAGLSAAGVSSYFVPEDLAGPGYWIDYDELDGMVLAHLSKVRSRFLYEIAKRCLDMTVSAAFLVFLAPLLALIAALIKLTSSGPALFLQDRVGKDGRVFPMYKFRTMFPDAPTYAYSPRGEQDPRITPLGRFLRHTSLDELPQLANVLFGDMSLVGPRPEMPFIVAQYTPLQLQRLTVKPGITGLWQMSADRAFLIHQNIEYDLYYARHRSLAMDIAILLHTVLFAARGI